MNTKDLVESLNEIAVNDLSEGANIVDHPAHMAAIELIGLDVMRADVRRLTDENAKLKREVDMAEKQSLDFYVEKENAAERQLKLISDQVQKNELLEAERDELREQLRWSPSEDQIMAAITSSNCGLKRVKWKDGIDINLPSGEALSFVAAILEFRPKQDKGSDK